MPTKRCKSKESLGRIALLKEFFKDLCEEEKVRERKKEIKRTKSSKVFTFVDLPGAKPRISEQKVVRPFNYRFLKSYLSTFVGDLPTKLETREVLTWASKNFGLNDFSHDDQHEAWAKTEGDLIRGLAMYVCNLRQRNIKHRKGHEKMGVLKSIVKMRLQELNLLQDNDKKVPTKGRSSFEEENIAILNQWRPHLRYLSLPENWKEKKTFTLQPPEDLPHKSEETVTSIQVLLDRGAGNFYIMPVSNKWVARVNMACDENLKANDKQQGVSITWSKRGCQKAWICAVKIAGWEEPETAYEPASLDS